MRLARPGWFASNLRPYLSDLSILLGGHLIAVQIRLRLPWGNRLGDEYQANPPAFLIVMALSLILARLLATLSGRRSGLRKILNPDHRGRMLIVATGLSVLGSLVFAPDLSQLQLIYYTIACLALIGTLVMLLRRLAPESDWNRFGRQLVRLWQTRYLLSLWLRYNVQARYSQTILGIVWIIVLPLTTAFVLAIAFSEILRIKTDVPFVVFLLTGLVPWSMFQAGIANGTSSIINRMGLIQQVNFPRETITLLVLGEAVVDTFFTFIAMLLVNLLYGFTPNIYYLLIPFLLLILLSFTIGLMFILSCLAIMVRDIPQLVGVALQLGFYLTPIVYPVSSIPEQFQVLLLLNPMASVIQAFRDIILFARPPDIIMLLYPGVIAFALLYAGYVYFKANEERFTDFS